MNVGWRIPITSIAEAGGLRFVHFGGGPDAIGPPLVLLHGAGGSHLSWPAELRRMPGRPVFALDLAGHGQSRGPAPATVGGHVDRVLDWMRSAGLPGAVLVGQSLGAAIALSAALRDPGSVHALVLFGASAQMAVNSEILAMTADQGRQGQAHEWIVKLSFSRAAPASMLAAARERVHPVSLQALHNDFLACDRFDLSARLDEIKLPALVICGEDDRMTPVESCRALAGRLPNARFKIVLRAGHTVILERTKRAADLVRDFLSWARRAGWLEPQARLKPG